VIATDNSDKVELRGYNSSDEVVERVQEHITGGWGTVWEATIESSASDIAYITVENWHDDVDGTNFALDNLQFAQAELSTDPADGNTLGFGNVRVGTSNAASLGVKNTGDSKSVLNGDFPGATGDFSPTSTESFSLAEGESTSRTYTYAPGQRGDDSVDITVTSNGGDSEVTLNGKGVGPDLSYQATDTAGTHGETRPLNGANGNYDTGLTLDLGNADWLVGPDTVTASLTLTNDTTDGDLDSLTDLTILDFKITGTDADMFSLLEADGDAFAPSVLSKDESLDLIVQFEADALLPHGLKEAILTFFTDQGAPFGENGATFRFTLNATQTPEPGSLLVWSLVGAVGLALGWRRRRNVAQAA
jgi:hypothetical protein